MTVRKLAINRIKLVREKEEEYNLPHLKLAYPRYVADFILNVLKIQDEPNEVCWAIYTNAKNEYIGAIEIGRGGLSSCVAPIRTVIAGALLQNAKNIILTHNHPSGHTIASMQDNDLTEEVGKAAKMMGMKLNDHIIISSTGRYYSYNENDDWHLINFN